MPELFVEFFSEEIPARMQLRAAEDLKSLAEKYLGNAGFENLKMESYVTPRRLVLYVHDLPAQQPDRSEEIKGPRIDAPEQALNGFMQANGLKSLDGVEKREVGKGTHYFIVRNEKGLDTVSVIKALTFSIQNEFSWPKSMHWGGARQEDEMSWVRPLHNISFIFGGKSYSSKSGIDSEWVNEATFSGHRFLSPKPFKAKSFDDYKKQLQKNNVILDQNERRTEILQQAEKLAAKQKLTLRQDDALLDEVTGLVEWPTAMLGTFEKEYLHVPQECLIATMRTNQKYFPLFDAAGKLSNHFILIANVPGSKGEGPIVSGNERVLRARLSDAKFFYDQDLKIKLDDRLPKLKDIQFHAKLGTLQDRVVRMSDIARRLATYLGTDEQLALRAGQLCKADLVTGMVGEFPELQGIMGRYYALYHCENEAVADAIRDHYQPAGANADVPTAPVSIALALADKFDVLNEFFRIDEKPTGSKDPYALRRAALGVIRILLENNIQLPLSKFVRPDVVEFIKDRLQVALRDQGIGHDRVKASLTDTDDVTLIAARANALNDLLATPTGAALLATYRRAANILKAEEKKDQKTYSGAVSGDALREEVEINLNTALNETAGKVGAALEAHRYAEVAGLLAALQPYLDAFFDKVMVNAEDAGIRTNRLNLLGQIRNVCHQFADFSQIEG